MSIGETAYDHPKYYVTEVSPPGWGHTKAEKEKTKPWKPKSKIGGSAAQFNKDLESGKFKENMDVSLINDGPVTFWLEVN